MGTVQKIVESLIRVSDDKKGQLSARCSEHSAWMKGELDVIRQLIKKNPRDDHKANDENVAPVHSQVLNSSSNRSSSESNDEDNAMRLKRKSPEIDVIGSRNSPDLKRNSTQDYEELATSAGLPTDLNRLKKEQLLEELEGRGNIEFSMKSLKKDLVDALKDALLKCSKESKNTGDCDDDHNNRFDVHSSEINLNAIVMSEEQNAILESATANNVSSNISVKGGPEEKEITLPLLEKIEIVKKTRNGSLMAEFRNLINNPPASQKLSIESESDRAFKIQNEYQARQQRHRQSQTGKIPKEFAGTDSNTIAVLIDSSTSLPPGKIVEKNEEKTSEIPSLGAEMDLVFSPLKSVNNNHSQNDGNNIIETVQLVSPSAISKMMDLGSSIPSIPSTTSANGTLEEDISEDPSDRESMSSTSTYSTVHSSLSLAFNTIGTSGTSQNNNSHITVAQINNLSNLNAQQSVLIKKPTNLMGGQSTFIERPPVAEKATTKSVIVPALERARQAKLAEDAKVMQKKKDLERKIALLNANTLSATGKQNSSGNLAPRQAPTPNPAVRAVPSSSVPSTAVNRIPINPPKAVSIIGTSHNNNNNNNNNNSSSGNNNNNSMNTSNTSGSNTCNTSTSQKGPGTGTGVGTVALNPFAATSHSSTKPKNTDYEPLGSSQTTDTTTTAGTDTKGIFGFLNSSKKSPVNTTQPISALIPASTLVPITIEAVPVPVKSTRRRTLDGKSPTAAALLSSSSGLNPASTPVHVITSISSPDTPTDTYSVNSCSTNNSYTTASLPDGPGKNSESLVKCTESEKEKVKEKEEKDSKECERTLPSPTLIPINEAEGSSVYPPAVPTPVQRGQGQGQILQTPVKIISTSATTILPSASLRSPSGTSNATPAVTIPLPTYVSSLAPLIIEASIPLTPVNPPNKMQTKTQVQDPTKKQVAIVEDEEEEEEEEEDQYEMQQREESDSSRGDDEFEVKDGEEDSGTDDEQEKKKRIPEWARGALLKTALEKQYGLNGHTPMDPDLIFHEVQTCSLEEIFGIKEGKSGVYAKRTSSAAWDQDSLSLIEKRTYRSQMGYGGIAASGGKR